MSERREIGGRQSRTSRSELIASPVTAVETRRDSSRADSRLRHARASENARQPSGSADPRLSRCRDKMMTLTTMSSFLERHFRRECRSLSPPAPHTQQNATALGSWRENARLSHSASLRGLPARGRLAQQPIASIDDGEIAPRSGPDYSPIAPAS